MHKQRHWLIHRETDGVKKERKSKTQTLLSMLGSRYWISVISARCGGCHPKGLIVPR